MKFKILETIQKYACPIETLKDNLRKTDDIQDDYLYSLISAATKKAEAFTGRQIVRAKILGYCKFAGKIQYEIPKGAFIVVEKIEFILSDDTTLTLESGDYTEFIEELSAFVFIKAIDKISDVSRIHPAAVQITFSAGWDGSEEMRFPEDVVNAIAMNASRMYLNPDDSVDERNTTADNLLRSYQCPIL